MILLTSARAPSVAMMISKTTSCDQWNFFKFPNLLLTTNASNILLVEKRVYYFVFVVTIIFIEQNTKLCKLFYTPLRLSPSSHHISIDAKIKFWFMLH